MTAQGRDYRRKATRPALTVVFCAALAFWAACAAAYAQAQFHAASACAGAALAFAAASLAAALAAMRIRAKIAAVVVAAAAIGACLGAADGAHVHAQADHMPEGRATGVQVTLEEDSTDTGYGEVACGRVSVGEGGQALFSCRFEAGRPLLRGDRLLACVEFKRADLGEDRYLWSDGVCGELVVTSYERLAAPLPWAPLLALRAHAIEAIGDATPAHALLQALVCGYRRAFGSTGAYSQLYSDYQTCGLAHLVAVSGAHLVIVTSLFALLFKALRLPRQLAIVLLIAIMCSYLVLSGVPVSAVRATVMSSVGILALIGKRRPSSMNALGIGVFAILVASPSASVSVSFSLSVLSTAGIVLFSPLIRSWIDATPLARVSFVADGLSLTIASSVLSQLYACSIFDLLPLVSPLANVVCAPLFPLVCGSGLAAGIAQALGAPFAEVPAQLASSCAYLLNHLVSAMAGNGRAAVFFTMDTVAALAISGGAAAALWAIWPDARRAFPVAAVALAVVLAALFVPSAPEGIIMFDVGQGDSCIVQSQGETLLIDTGNHDSLLREELARNRISHIDSVLITHADDDHCGSLDVLEQAVQVDRVIVAADMLSCASDAARKLVGNAQRVSKEIVGVNAGDTFSVGCFDVEVIWPKKFTEDGGNADSLCVRLDYDGDSDGMVDHVALFTGDAEAEELASMIASGSVGRIDILKVGHHGSKNAMTEEQAEALHPQIALIGVGAGNRYGHPTQVILDMLERVSCRVLRTDLDGEVRCILSPDSISVSCIE